ncbi:MAG: YybH family protein [Steroidobacteraceae bacterium]
MKDIAVVTGGLIMTLQQWITAGLIVLGLSTGTAPAQTGGDAAVGVRAADAAWLKVYAAKDLEKTVAFYDEQGSVLAPNAPIATGKAAVAKSIASDFAFGDLLWHADQAGVSRSGDLGYTSGTYKFTFKDPSGKPVIDNGKYLTVWKKQADGSWKVLYDMFNTDMPPS